MDIDLRQKIVLFSSRGHSSIFFMVDLVVKNIGITCIVDNET